MAAYFAARGAREWQNAKFKKNRPKTSDRLALWAVRLPFVRNYWSPPAPRVRIVTVPRAANLFLHQQEGLFLVDMGAGAQWGQQGNPLPMDDLLYGVEDAARARLAATGGSALEPVIMRITVPATEATDLVNLLSDEGWDMRRLMPTFDRIVDELSWWRTHM